MADTDLQKLAVEIREFVAERDWEQFHTPKNLSMALAVEAAELLEHFQWLSPEQSASLDAGTVREVQQEIADVMICLIRLSDRLSINLVHAVREKLAINRSKYPANLVRGKSTKYDKY